MNTKIKKKSVLTGKAANALVLSKQKAHSRPIPKRPINSVRPFSITGPHFNVVTF